MNFDLLFVKHFIFGEQSIECIESHLKHPVTSSLHSPLAVIKEISEKDTNACECLIIMKH